MALRIGEASFPAGAQPRLRRFLVVAAGFGAGVGLALAAAPAGERASAVPAAASPIADRPGAPYRNPILFSDWSDPDVVRVGDDYWLVASSFHEVPGLPLLRSRDLVHWELAGHAAPTLPSPRYDEPRHGGGAWAPSIRFDDGLFEVWWGDPDAGIYTTRARDPRGPWGPPRLVLPGKGLIDPCPFRDADGSRWLVHAWAKSRAGFNGILTVRRLSPDGLSAVGEGVNVFDGGTRHPTIEGPKLYRRGEWVYVFAPAGGVKTGWQTVLRSRSVLGPYEARVVLEQGTTHVNGPHQGALVETPGGESWFVHFQDRGPYGRITHLEPVAWKDGWPAVGEDSGGDGRGQPVVVHAAPRVARPGPAVSPQVSDEFDCPALGAMWAWNANPQSAWSSLSARRGALRLYPAARAAGPYRSLQLQPNVLRTRFPRERFTATTLVELNGATPGSVSGLAVLGRDVAAVGVARTPERWEVVHLLGRDVLDGGADAVVARRPARSGRLFLRVAVEPGARLRFSTSEDGSSFTPIGAESGAREGAWVGARLGLFTLPLARRAGGDFTDVEWFRIE